MECKLRSVHSYACVPHYVRRTIFYYQKAALYAQEGIQNDKFIWDPKGKWSKIAYKISHHPVFHVFDLGVSILLMLLALIEKPAVFDTDKLIVTVRNSAVCVAYNAHNNRLCI